MEPRRALPARPRVPGYRVERYLGRGGFGEVWQARVRRTGVAVALKRLPMADAEQRAAALREAAVLSALDHPHLVRLHDIVRLNDAVVLVLDLAPAGTLAQIVAARGRLIPGETVTAVAPVAAALAYAHESGVVHGDVTPANILFVDNGMPLLADLGVARLRGSDAPLRTTAAFADPTVASGTVPGPAGDVFMVAGVALFALTGEPPWRGRGPVSSGTDAPRVDAAARLRAVEAPARMIEVIERALAPEPADRGSAAEFALDLRASTRAVAVELAAGRVRPVAARAARPVAAADTAAGSEPFTDGIRLPSPFAAGPRRRIGRLRLSGAAFAVLAVLAALAVVLAGMVARQHPHRRGGSATAAAAVSAPPAASPPAAGAPAPKHAVAPEPAHPAGRSLSAPPRTVRVPGGRAVLSAASASRVLRALDAARALAFAARNPVRLRRVYAAAELFARDRALLLRLVPAGCGLAGVRTDYREVRVLRAAAGSAIVAAQARMRPSRLLCAGAPVDRARGTRPTQLELRLVGGASGYRVSWIRRAPR